VAGYVIRGAILGVLMVSATVLITLAGASSVAGEPSRTGLAALGIGMSTLLANAMQGSAEEVLFRGWLLPAIGGRDTPSTAIIFSAVIFSLAHALNGLTLLGFVNLFLFGVLMALWTLAESGLWGVAAFHATWNWCFGNVLGLTVSGSADTGLLISMRLTGADLITGGAFGPEGGIGVTTVILIALGTILTRLKNKQNPA
jgi:membrane protease YdiL (CAAX protease family)